MQYLRLVALALVLLVGAACSDHVSPLSPANGPAGAWSASDITYDITLDRASYDAAEATTTFTYTVKSNPSGGPAISHWVIAFAPGVTPIITGASETGVTFGTDPTTGVRGIKFDSGYAGQEIRTVRFTLEGAWALGESTVAVKASAAYRLGTVRAPVAIASAQAPATYDITGTVFLDVTGDGALDSDEPGMAGIEVVLSSGLKTVTDADGRFRFAALGTGSYRVSVAPAPGFLSSSASEVAVVLTDSDQDTRFGQSLDVAALAGQTARGYTIGFWKNNISKAVRGTTKGVQVSAATLLAYQQQLAGYALEPLNIATLAEALPVLSSTSSAPVDLLKKQLMASEFNTVSGAAIGGNARATAAFTYWGEYMVKHRSRYTDAQILCAKDWFDAYNNSHGAAVVAPACTI